MTATMRTTSPTGMPTSSPSFLLELLGEDVVVFLLLFNVMMGPYRFSCSGFALSRIALECIERVMLVEACPLSHSLVMFRIVAPTEAATLLFVISFSVVPPPVWLREMSWSTFVALAPKKEVSHVTNRAISTPSIWQAQ